MMRDCAADWWLSKDGLFATFLFPILCPSCVRHVRRHQSVSKESHSVANQTINNALCQSTDILQLTRTKQYRSINCLFKSIKPLCCLEQCSSLGSLAANDHWNLRGYNCLPNYLRTWSSLRVVSTKKENQSNVLCCALKWSVYMVMYFYVI